MRFDASIDLTLGQRRHWMGTPAGAVSAVGVAVRALPGAGWIDVEYCGDAPGDRVLRLYPQGRSRGADGAEWDRLGDEITRTVRHALHGPR